MAAKTTNKTKSQLLEVINELRKDLKLKEEELNSFKQDSQSTDDFELNGTALGLTKVDDNYVIPLLKFDIESGKAKVIENIKVDNNPKDYALAIHSLKRNMLEKIVDPIIQKLK